MKNIVVICDDINCVKRLQEEANKLGYEIIYEIQTKDTIENEIKEQDIKSSECVLFSLNRRIEDIINIERFIDVEYYEVEPNIVINNANQVISEIIEELNN